MHYYEIASFEKQIVLLKQHSSPTGSVVIGAEASPDAAAGVNDPDEDEDMWHLDGAVNLDNVDGVCAKRPIFDFHIIFLANKRMVRGTVAEAFQFTSKMLNQEAAADAVSSTVLFSVKGVLATVLAEATKANDQLTLLE